MLTPLRALGLAALVAACGKGDKAGTAGSGSSAGSATILETVGDLETAQLGDSFVVRSVDHLMTVPFPARPKLSIQTMNGGIGPVKMTMAMYDMGDTAYGVLTSKMAVPPEGRTFDLERVYNAARDGAAKGTNGKVIDDNKYELAGLPARHFTIQFTMSGVDIEQQQWTVYVPWQNASYTYTVAHKVGDHSFDDKAAKLVAGVTIAHPDAGSGSGTQLGIATTTIERWMWIVSAGGTYLEYYYVDATAGPSSKGDLVSDPPTAAELTAVTTHPTHTTRDPIHAGARFVTSEEHDKLKLPSRPAWLDTFEPPGSKAPLIPPTKEVGRPVTSHSMVIQRACGRFAGNFWVVEGGATLVIGAAKSDAPKSYAWIEDAGVLPKHATIDNAAAGMTITPEPSAVVTVDDKPITGPTKLAVDARIGIGKTTLIVRPASFQPPRSGVDPSCPGFADILWIEDGCSMFGTSSQQLVGGFDMIVGTDTPVRAGMPKGFGAKTPTRVKLFNDHATVKFTAENPKRLPKVKGKPKAKGDLKIGDQITVGDRVFIVTGPNEEKSISNTPLASCPEAKVKAKKKKP